MKKVINGKDVELSPEEEAEILAEWSANEAAQAVNQYKTDRQAAHITLADQLDMIYWDKINNTTLWADYVTNIKATIPKP
jgi:hypothetical protein